MGKKKITTQAGDSAIKEGAAVDTAVVKVASAKKSKRITEGKVFVNATYNNTVITVTDVKGNVVAWASGRFTRFFRSEESNAVCIFEGNRGNCQKIQRRARMKFP